MRRRLRINQIVTDFALKPPDQYRILDIASLEGDYSAEFASRGVGVLGVEGRQINFRKEIARCTLPNIKFVQNEHMDETPKVPAAGQYAAQPVSLRNRIARKFGLT